MAQFTIPEKVLWNPIISAGISRYLSETDRLNCKSFIPTWDILTTRTIALSPTSWGRQAQLLALLQDTSLGFEISSADFSSERGKHVLQLLFLLSGPSGTGLVNVTTLDIVNQPISIEQLHELFSNCPMPRLRVLALTVVAMASAARYLQFLNSEKLELEDVTLRCIGRLSQREKLLLMRSFGKDVRSISFNDSSHHPSGMRLRRETCLKWIPAWTALQIHHDSDVLNVFLAGKKTVAELPDLTLLTEPGHFFPSRCTVNSSILPRILKYRTLKKPPFNIPQCCRACASAEDRLHIPRLQCPLDGVAEDGEAPVNFVACSLMSVEDNSLLRPLNLRDLYIHLRPPGTNSTPANALASAISLDGIQVKPVRCAVEALIQRQHSEIEHLSLRLCKPGSKESKSGVFVQELPSLVGDYFLPLLEMCASSIRFLEVSAEIIWACCSRTLVRKRLLRLQDQCSHVRKAAVLASDDLGFAQQLRPSAKGISTYLSVFPSLEEVHIIGVDIFRDQTLHEILVACAHLRRLYIFSLQTSNFQYAALPAHSALELLFLDINGLSVEIDFRVLLNRTLSNIRTLKYLLMKFDNGWYPTLTSLKAFFADRTELRWLVVVINETHDVVLCHANGDTRTDPEILKAHPCELEELISTYPELYDIFWNEFQTFSNPHL